jgi:hypothetical protein
MQLRIPVTQDSPGQRVPVVCKSKVRSRLAMRVGLTIIYFFSVIDRNASLPKL